MKRRMNFTLNNNELWNWLESDKGIEPYLLSISKLILDKSYIVEQRYEAHTNAQPSKIMNQLSLSIPRKYFLELQYCAKAYATIFSKVFPKLATYIDEMIYIEWLLYVEPDTPKYRDHLVHMFKVAYVGDTFMNNKTLLDKIVKRQFTKSGNDNCESHFRLWLRERGFNADDWDDNEREEIIKIAFFIAALFHDLGYGHYYLNKYKERLFRIYPWLLPDINQIDANACVSQGLLYGLPAYFIRHNHYLLNTEDGNGKHTLSKLKQRQLTAGFFRDCLPLNHSIASSFFVSHIAEDLFKSRSISEKLYVAFNIAAEAAMLHDMTKEERCLHLNCGFLNNDSDKTVPLAVLLILSDEISVWERHRIKYEQNDESVSYKLDTENMIKSVEVFFVEGKVELRPIYVNNKPGNAFEKEFRDALNFAETTEEKKLKFFDFDLVIRD